MHIALLTHEPFHPPTGGGSAAALYLVRELVRRRHQVTVFGPSIANPDQVCREHGIRFVPFTAWPMGRTTPWRTLKYLAYPTALGRRVRQSLGTGAVPPIDLILAQHSISAVAAASLKRSLGVPTVLNLLDCLTGFMETWPPLLMPRPVARALVRFEVSLPRRGRADAVLTVSDPLRERILATGYPADRTHAIYYGYDAGLFQPPPVPRAGSPATAGPLVVMHGSFDHHHLGPIAHRAVSEIVRVRPDVRFRFIGPRTPAAHRLLEAVRRTHPAAHLEATGFVPYREIPGRIAEADVGITPYEPSTGTHCAFVAKTVEYLAVGIPVVSTPLESATRYYAGLAGIRFSGSDGAGFAEAVLNWLDLPARARREAVEPARLKVAAELDWNAVCTRAALAIEAAGRPDPGRA